MRYPGSIWRGTEKHGYPNTDTHFQNGVVIHSMEGSLQAGFGVLDGARQASWHFSISKTGEVYQHVDTDNIAWTNGGFDANRLFWGIECEGVEGEPLTEPQFDALLGVVRWLWDVHDVGAFVRQETAWEHNEMTRYGSAPTSCPSGRIPWERLIQEMEDEMLSEEDLAKIDVIMERQIKRRTDDYIIPKVEKVVKRQLEALPPGGGLTAEETVEAHKQAAREGSG